MQPVRIFLAIPLPPEARDHLAELERTFTLHRAALRWVSPQNLHLTVRFLGPVPPDRLPSVGDAARAAAAGFAPFALRRAAAGAFPNTRSPRVIWVGLESGPALETLRALVGRTEEELATRGFPREAKPYAPHITLARVRDGIQPPARVALGEDLTALVDRGPVGDELPVREVLVMRSDLGRGAPLYTPIAAAPLGG